MVSYDAKPCQAKNDISLVLGHEQPFLLLCSSLNFFPALPDLTSHHHQALSSQN
jgi:hypothetical protein